MHALAPWVLGVGVFVGTITTPRRPPYPLRFGQQWPALTIIAVALASAIAAGAARRHPVPLYLMALIGWVTLSMWPAVAAAAYYLVVSSSPDRGRTIRVLVLGLASAVLVVLPLAAERARGDQAAPLTAGLYGAGIASIMIGLPITVGLWVDARRHVVAGLRERAERLESEQAARTNQARVEERARIAHEMHDLVAHKVSLMVLHAGALEVRSTDEHTVEAAALIRSTGREALVELRQMLGILRSSGTSAGSPPSAPQPTLADLDRLLEVSRAAGIPVERREESVSVGGWSADGLPTAVDRAAYRVIQEALTNVAKHAGQVPTTVALHRSPDRLEIEVTNTAPPGARPAAPIGGFGLVGLRERIGLLGGSVQTGPTASGGFTVRARIPLIVPDPLEPSTGE